MYEDIKNIYPEIPIGCSDNLTDKHFGNWTVLYRTKNNSQNKSMWVCQCSCENKTIKSVTSASLKAGASTSCGCTRLERISKNNDIKIHIRDENGNIIKKKCYRCKQWLPIKNFYKSKHQKDGYSGSCKLCDAYSKESRYNIYLKNAKKRNINFHLSKENFYYITSKSCYYCGEYSNKDTNGILYNGIDRVDSSKGYILDNVVPCCDICNKMKLDYDTNFFLNHIKKILKHKGVIK